jgi:DNA-binding transcriptional ArsR family regulator
MGERKHSEPALDDIFLALSHPTRRRILELLQERPSRVTDLAASFDLSLNVVSKHLKSLERAGLLVRTREGRVHTLRSEPRALDPATAWLSRHLAMWQGALNSLESFIIKSKSQPPTP